MRARPKGTIVVVACLFAGLCGWAGVELWCLYHYNAAARAFEEDRLADARSDIEACLRFWSGRTKAHLLAARIERLSGGFKQAAEHLKKCRDLEGMTETTQLEWLLIRAQSGEIADVESGLRQLIERDHPQSHFILTALARGFVDDSRYHAAYGCLNRLLRQRPNDIRALHWRGWAREHLGDMPGAAEDYGRVLELAPERWAVRLRLLETLLHNKNTAAVTEHAEILARSHGDDPEVRVALARCRMLKGEDAEARDILDRLISEHPQMGWALYYRGKVEDSDAAAAEAWYRRALEADPGLSEARFALYFNLQRQGKKAAATTQLADYKAMEEKAKELTEVLLLLERSPKNVELLTNAGTLFLQVGNEQMGQQFLYKALDADHRYKKAHEILGRYFETKKNAERASYHLRMAGKQ
jgi:tetratricopeptide (TPR) repeat protein